MQSRTAFLGSALTELCKKFDRIYVLIHDTAQVSSEALSRRGPNKMAEKFMLEICTATRPGQITTIHVPDEHGIAYTLRQLCEVEASTSGAAGPLHIPWPHDDTNTKDSKELHHSLEFLQSVPAISFIAAVNLLSR